MSKYSVISMLWYWIKYALGNCFFALSSETHISWAAAFPIRYYHNITSNTLTVLEAMSARGVPTLIYSSTCATYGEPEKMPITEGTPQVSVLKAEYASIYLPVSSMLSNSWEFFLKLQLPINPYGKAKKMAEDIILDFSKTSDMAVMILRFVLYFFIILKRDHQLILSNEVPFDDWIKCIITIGMVSVHQLEQCPNSSFIIMLNNSWYE